MTSGVNEGPGGDRIAPPGAGGASSERSRAPASPSLAASSTESAPPASPELLDAALSLLRAWGAGAPPSAPPAAPILPLIAFADAQKVAPPICAMLAEALPGPAARLLTDTALGNAALFAEARLADLRLAARPLNAAGIEPVALKGVAFAAREGAPQPWRRMVDVDILIPADRFAEALAVLRDDGWTGPDGRVRTNVFGCYAHPTLGREGAASGLEVHVRCSYEAHGALEGMAERAIPSAIPGIRIPSPEDRMAHMVHHSQIMGRGWRRRSFELRDACDWRVLRDREDPDLDAVAARFEKLGDAPAFRSFAALMARIWDEDLPARLTEGAGDWPEETLRALVDPTRAEHWRRPDFRRAAWELATRPGMLNEYASRLLVPPHRDTTVPRIGAMIRRLTTGAAD